jgi:hypothetical protein
MQIRNPYPAIIISDLFIYQRMTVEMLWCKIAHQSLLGKTEEMLPAYKQLHKQLSENGTIQRSRAALHKSGEYVSGKGGVANNKKYSTGS